MIGFKSLRHALLMSVAAFGGAATVSAIESPAYAQEVTRTYNIQPQDLNSALREFAVQTGRDVLYPPSIVAGKRSSGAQGQLTERQALEALLAGTGLRFSQTASNGYAVQDPTSPTQLGAGNDQVPSEEIVVTGTNIRGSAPIGANLITVGRDEIEARGYSSVQELVQSVPQNSSSGQLSDFAAASGNRGQNTTLGTGINLRGLGARASLTLLNGRRLGSSGLGRFVDISTIPLAGVERMEVLADGASAIYGSDAVAGVVNFVLRRDYEGAETSVAYRGTTGGGGEELQFSQLFGANWADGNLLVGYEYTDRAAISNSQRDATSGCDFRPQGGSNRCSVQSNPGNITLIGSTPVTLAIPFGQDGTSLDQSELIAGQINFYNPFHDVDLSPPFQRNSAFAVLRQELSENAEFFFEGFYGHRDFEYDVIRVGQLLIVPQSNAYRQLNNLFPGQGNMFIQYNIGRDLGLIDMSGYSESWRGVGGLRFDLNNSWSVETFGAIAHSSDRTNSRNVVDTAALNAALASSNLATSFNPFADGSNTPQSVLTAIRGARVTEALDTETVTVGTKADGELFTLPADPVRFAFGVERRTDIAGYDQFVYSGTGAITSSFQSGANGYGRLDREVWSGFAEVAVPIFGPANRLPGFESLDLSASIRTEHYSDFGDTTNPKFGLSWSPVPGLVLRGTYGTSFSVAQLNDVLLPVTASPVPIPASIDPLATGGSTNTLFVVGGNPDLGPEEGETFTYGFSFSPTALPNLHLSATYYDITIENSISTPASVFPMFTDPAYAQAGLFIRNPTAAQVADAVAQASIPPNPPIVPATIEAILFASPQNVGALATQGVDLQFDYTHETGLGDFGFALRANYIFELTQSPALGVPAQDRAGLIGFPSQLTAHGTLSWSTDQWGAVATINYVDEYEDRLSVPARRIESWTTLDGQISYSFGDRNGSSNGTRLALSVINAFDEPPPFANSTLVAYDAANANAIGRQISLRITHDW